MKAIILAGGLGSRLSEETVLRPKPMVEIGGRPILWHIMNIHAAHGITEFIVALGYKAEVVKEYFLNFYAFNNDLSIDLASGRTTIHDGKQPNWKIHLVDTGLHTQTGGRLKRLASVAARRRDVHVHVWRRCNRSRSRRVDAVSRRARPGCNRHHGASTLTIRPHGLQRRKGHGFL